MKRLILLLAACTDANPEFDGTRSPTNVVAASPSPEVAIGAPCDREGPGCASGLACCEAKVDPQHIARTICLPPGWCADDEAKGEDDE